jgi:hypothetical protein
MKRRFTLALAAAVAVGLIATSMWNHSAYAELGRIDAAIADAATAHVIQWDVKPSGERVKSNETWYKEGRYRSEGTGVGRPSVTIFADGTLWNFDTKANKVTFQKAKGPFGYNPSGFSIRAMQRDFARWGWKDKIHVIGNTALNGRAVRQVELEMANEPVRVLFWVDLDTDLPIQFEKQAKRGDDWKTDGGGEFEFNRPVPDTLFDPHTLSKTATFFNKDEGKRIWGERLSHPIASKKVGDRTLAVRDVQVNEAGDVFVLYTAGNKPGLPSNVSVEEATQSGNNLDWRLRLTDDLGTRYIANHSWTFLPVMDRQHPSLPNGYLFNGEKLEGAWFVTEKSLNGRRPRQLTVTFYVQPIIKGGEPPLDGAKLKTDFTLPVSPTTPVLIPEWMPYMALGPWREADLNYERVRARGNYFREKGDLPQALEQFREALRLSTADIKFSEWQDIARTLWEMGRKDEARQAVEKSLDQPMVTDSMKKEAQHLLQLIEIGKP